eukprot:scaffold317_cov101-Isochrysis_galbana.AAC.3
MYAPTLLFLVPEAGWEELNQGWHSSCGGEKRAAGTAANCADGAAPTAGAGEPKPTAGSALAVMAAQAGPVPPKSACRSAAVDGAPARLSSKAWCIRLSARAGSTSTSSLAGGLAARGGGGRAGAKTVMGGEEGRFRLPTAGGLAGRRNGETVRWAQGARLVSDARAASPAHGAGVAAPGAHGACDGTPAHGGTAPSSSAGTRAWPAASSGPSASTGRCPTRSASGRPAGGGCTSEARSSSPVRSERLRRAIGWFSSQTSRPISRAAASAASTSTRRFSATRRRADSDRAAATSWSRRSRSASASCALARAPSFSTHRCCALSHALAAARRRSAAAAAASRSRSLSAAHSGCTAAAVCTRPALLRPAVRMRTGASLWVGIPAGGMSAATRRYRFDRGGIPVCGEGGDAPGGASWTRPPRVASSPAVESPQPAVACPGRLPPAALGPSQLGAWSAARPLAPAPGSLEACSAAPHAPSPASISGGGGAVGGGGGAVGGGGRGGSQRTPPVRVFQNRVAWPPATCPPPRRRRARPIARLHPARAQLPPVPRLPLRTARPLPVDGRRASQPSPGAARAPARGGTATSRTPGEFAHTPAHARAPAAAWLEAAAWAAQLERGGAPPHSQHAASTGRVGVSPCLECCAADSAAPAPRRLAAEPGAGRHRTTRCAASRILGSLNGQPQRAFGQLCAASPARRACGAAP